MKIWHDLSECAECGADSAKACAPYCTAAENRTGKIYVFDYAGKLRAARYAAGQFLIALTVGLIGFAGLVFATAGLTIIIGG